jgi:hypothetical protein
VTTPAISKPDTVSGDLWDEYTRIMARADAGRMSGENNARLEQIYVVAPELRGLGQ